MAAPVQAVPAQTITIPAGGSASLQVRGFAMQPGGTMPQGALALADPALPGDRIRITLFYGIDWGYTETNPDQVAQAIWYAQTGSWQTQDHAIAERIANAAAGAPGLPFWNVDGQSLLTLATQGRVTVSPLALVEGQGTLTLTNTTGQDIPAYLPYGTLFGGPNGSVVVWATGADQAPEATATTQAAAPTAEATQPPTQEPEATATPTTGQGYVKPGATPPSPPTQEANPSPTASAVTSEATNTPEQQPADHTATATATENARPGGVMPPVPAVEPPTQTPVPPATATATTVPYVKGGTGNSTALPASPTESKPAATPTNTAAPAARAAGSGAQASQQQNEAASTKNSNEVPAVRASAPENAPAPPPVATAAGQGTGVPGAVNTAEPQVPNPQLTQVATVAPIKPHTSTPALKPTFTPSPAATVNRGNDTGGNDTGKATPTPIAKPPVPAPTPLPPTDPSTDTGPTIIVSGTPGTPPSDGKPAGGKAPVPPVQGNVGTPPNTNPNTGGGQSTLPAWLSLFSALMLAGGWALRRMSNAPVPATATAEISGEEKDPETLN